MFKQVWLNLYKNKFNYVATAALMQFLVASIGVYCLSLIFKSILWVSGVSNLNQSSILIILKNPFSLALILVYVLALALVMFFEFSVLTFMVYGSFDEARFSFKTTLKNALVKTKILFSPQIIFFALYFISMVPLLNLGLSSALTEGLYIPKFITGELLKTTQGTLGIIVGFIVLFYVNLKLIFVLPLTVINNDTIWQNIKTSWILTKKNKVRLFVGVSLIELVFIALALFLILFLTIFTIFMNPDGSSLVLQTTYFMSLKYVFFFFTVLSKLALLATLVLVIKENEVDTENILELKTTKQKNHKLLIVFSVVSMIFMGAYNALLLYTSEGNKNIITIAHRGVISKGVENSIEALEAAAQQKADYVEMDILLTKDNKFVVMHDYNLSRLAGVNKRVQDMNYDEVVGLPISQNGFTSKIPSFEEYVAKAKELGVKLLVELKPHGGEGENYPDLFIEKMRELGVDKEYICMSLDLELVQKINQKAPELVVGHVIALQMGPFANDNVDFYALEDFSYSDTLAYQAILQDRPLYIWTVNDEETAVKYLINPVAGIITDYPDMVIKEKEDIIKNNSYFDRLFRLITTTVQ